MDDRKILKRSQLHAQDYFDYEKLKAAGERFLECEYEAEGEDICFIYEMDGKKPLEEILKEEKEMKYRLLINFAGLEEAYMRYQIPFGMDELYYDDNYLLYVRERDLYEPGKGGSKEGFLNIYKAFAGGILSRRYSVEKLLESGIEILKGEKGFQKIYECESAQEVKEEIRRRKEELAENTRRSFRMVSKRGFLMWRITAVAAVILTLALGAGAFYFGKLVIPKQEAVIAANKNYIVNDYVGCIDSLASLTPEEMDRNTKYILAASYARSESLKQEEITVIVEKLSPESNEKELDYWIYLGRRELQEAENMAMALSDDKLLVYAYMKEADILEGNTAMDGAEKQERLDTLEQEIEKLGAKYEPEEAE